jgi:hypothetical protein
LIEKFPKLSDDKLREGVFIGPQICEIWTVWTLVDGKWEICVANTRGGLSKFPWKRNSQNYKELFEDLLDAYQTMLNFSPYLGAMIDKHAGRYHQDISTIEKWYGGTSSQHMLADTCWNLAEEKLPATKEWITELLYLSKIRNLFFYFCCITIWS